MRTANLNIDKWLGLHSDALGDTELKRGELSDMKNFKIVDGYNLEKRGGTTAQLETQVANVITNGNFTNTASWTGTASTLTAAGNVLSVTGSGAGTYPRATQSYSFPASPKFYVRCVARVTNAVCKNIILSADYSTVETITTPTINQWYTLSGVITSDSGSLVTIGNDYDTSAIANGKVLQVKEFLMVDLTTEFGAGNEPSAGECDLVMATFFASTANLAFSYYNGNRIQGQWYGKLNGSTVHLFSSGGRVWKNNGDGTATDLGTLTDAPTNFFQFEDTQGIEQTLGGDGTVFGNNTNIRVGQSFTPERDMRMTAITVELGVYDRTNIPADSVRVKLFSTSSGVPDTLLATSQNTVAGSALEIFSFPTATILYTAQTFYFDEYELTAGTVYALVVERTGSQSTTKYYSMPRTTSSVYSGGDHLLYTSSWAKDTAKDFWFMVNGRPEYSVYILNGTEYKKYNGGAAIEDVSGYVPIIYTGSTPDGTTKTAYEGLNSLTRQRRVQFNGDGLSTVYYLPEKSLASIDAVYVNGVGASTFTSSLTAGTVTFSNAPNTGVNNVEIKYTAKGSNDADILKQTNFCKYGGKNDTRIFLYGNGNIINYSELADGVLSAEYFPVLNYISPSEDESSVTLLVKQYDRLIIFKENRAYWSGYEYDDTLGASFTLYPLNDTIGCSVIGGGQLVQNNPHVMFENKLYEFVSSNVRDERNAVYKSLRVQPLLDAENMASLITFDNEESGELWISLGTEVYIYNYTFDVWYYYVFPFTITSICKVGSGLSLGTSGGQLMFTDSSTTDNGTMIDSYAKTGYIDYGTILERKFVNFVWLSMYLDGTDSTLDMYYETDADSETLIDELSYTTETKPQTIRMKPKMKKFVYGKFVFKNSDATKCRILGLSAPAIIGGIAK